MEKGQKKAYNDLTPYLVLPLPHRNISFRGLRRTAALFRHLCICILMAQLRLLYGTYRVRGQFFCKPRERRAQGNLLRMFKGA